MLSRTSAAMLALLALASTASAADATADRDEPAPSPIVALLNRLAPTAQSDIDDHSLSEQYGGGMREKWGGEYEQGLVELRISCWLWFASLWGKTTVSTGDMRLAEAFGNLKPFNTEIGHVDVVEDMHVAGSRLIVNPEACIRLHNFAIRASWWWWTETVEFTPDKIFAFGDIVYAVDQDGSAPGEEPNNRIPPDSPPSPLVAPKITFTSELMDTKIMLEGRLKAGVSYEVFVGLSIHWLRYKAQAHTDVRVFSADETGSILDRKPVTDTDLGDYPLISMSLRIEWKPYENYYFSLDVQEMYLYYGNYTDMKVAVWNQILPYVRIGAGYRIWSMNLELYNLGNQKTNIKADAQLTGLWVGLHIIV